MWRDTDNGFRRVFGSLTTLAGKLEAGVIGERAGAQHPKAEMSVAELAAIHEFGLGVPERSFIRAFFDDAQVPEAAAHLAREVAAGVITPAEFRRKLGAWVVEGMQHRMDEGLPPPLLPETLNRKSRTGPPVPVEDTLTTRNAINARWERT